MMKTKLLLAYIIFFLSAGNILSESSYKSITGSNVRLRSEPGLTSNVITLLQKKQKISIISKSTEPATIDSDTNHWYQIYVYGENVTGWVFGKYIGDYEVDKSYVENGITLNSDSCLIFPEDTIPDHFIGGYIGEDFFMRKNHTFIRSSGGFGVSQLTGHWKIIDGKISLHVDYDGGKEECLKIANEGVANNSSKEKYNQYEKEKHICNKKLESRKQYDFSVYIQNNIAFLKKNPDIFVFFSWESPKKDIQFGCIIPL